MLNVFRLPFLDQQPLYIFDHLPAAAEVCLATLSVHSGDLLLNQASDASARSIPRLWIRLRERDDGLKIRVLGGEKIE